MSKIVNTRINSTNQTVVIPEELISQFPISKDLIDMVLESRNSIGDVISGDDNRLVVVVGPCSIHSIDVALEYGSKLAPLVKKYNKKLIIIMRVYFEKPRTTIGWKGLINDPDLDQTHDLNKGLRLARELLIELHKTGVTAGTEYLDLITPQYFNDLISWGAIGARTTESQCHRQLASGLSCPVGFKNGTDGNYQIAIDAIQSAAGQHTFLSVTQQGSLASFSTAGNSATHVILRGGKTPNFGKENVQKISSILREKNLPNKIMIDCSHSNSHKDYSKQRLVVEDVCTQLQGSSSSLVGIMLESNLKPGKQTLSDKSKLEYGVSITDACIGWEETEELLSRLADSVTL